MSGGGEGVGKGADPDGKNSVVVTDEKAHRASVFL